MQVPLKKPRTDFSFKSGLDPKSIHDGMREHWFTSQRETYPAIPRSQPCTLCAGEYDAKQSKWLKECTNKCKG